MVDIQKLKQVVALADTLHFHRASERCHVSPSTLSRSIQQIETDLNTQIFDRTNRSVALTPQGTLFLAFARETLQQWETLQDTLLQSATELCGAISIYCSVTASYSFLFDILTDFRQRHPKIEIRLHTGDHADAIDRVVAGYEDIAIAARKDSMPGGVSFKRITHTPLVFIAPKDERFGELLPQESSAEFWQRVPMIISERGVARDRLDQWFRENNISPTIYAQVSGHEAIVSMVSLGFGIGLVPKIVVDNSPLTARVKLAPHQPTLEDYEVGVCVLDKRLKSPLIEAFWSQILSE